MRSIARADSFGGPVPLARPLRAVVEPVCHSQRATAVEEADAEAVCVTHADVDRYARRLRERCDQLISS